MYISIALSLSVSPIFINTVSRIIVSDEALVLDGQAPLDASALTVETFMNTGNIHLSISELLAPFGEWNFHQEN